MRQPTTRAAGSSRVPMRSLHKTYKTAGKARELLRLMGVTASSSRKRSASVGAAMAAGRTTDDARLRLHLPRSRRFLAAGVSLPAPSFLVTVPARGRNARLTRRERPRGDFRPHPCSSIPPAVLIGFGRPDGVAWTGEVHRPAEGRPECLEAWAAFARGHTLGTAWEWHSDVRYT
jgi:hypothetical protein